MFVVVFLGSLCDGGRAAADVAACGLFIRFKIRFVADVEDVCCMLLLGVPICNEEADADCAV